MQIDQLQFSVAELLSLLGLAQGLYVLVYMLFNAGGMKRALLPFLYFFVLSAAFFLDFAGGFIGDTFENYSSLQWSAWFMGPPLSVLLIIQIAQINKAPALMNYAVLLFLPCAFILARLITIQSGSCESLSECDFYSQLLTVTGLSAGALSFIMIWANRGMLTELKQQKGGKDRYWLILTLVFVNLFFLTVMLVSLSEYVAASDMQLIRTVLGLGFVYLASTSLFRIYPQAVTIMQKKTVTSGEDKALAQKIENLLNLDKVYHEPTYSRTDLARELDIPDSTVSRVINNHFGKSFPRLLNEKRVNDAKLLLNETKEPIKVIAEEVGFNSIASFNRVFKDIAGLTAGQYRKKK